MVLERPSMQCTPLDALHRELGGRMVPFAGYSMPLQYETGIIKEHLHTRSAAGLFDVSHMGQIIVRPLAGGLREAAYALEALLPSDIVGLAEGRQRYAVLTDDSAGILDDLMIANHGDHFVLVVNAARKEDDEAHLRRLLKDDCVIERRSNRALLALQGPLAEQVLAEIAPDTVNLRFMDVRTLTLAGVICEVARSGYTGEDGFEISVASTSAEKLARTLLKNPQVAAIGLGARDSLRLEAGLCLYGSDLTVDTDPIEAALEWSIQKVRRPSGARAGGFPGAEFISEQLAKGASRRRIGLRPQGSLPVRAGASIFAAAAPDRVIGQITSGGFGPSLGAPVAMGYVPTEFAKPGTALEAEVRGQRISVTACDLPFISHRYKRN